MKKAISLILAVLMLVSVFAIMPLTAYARYDSYEKKKNDEYEYLVNKEGTVEVYQYLGKDSEVVIPDTIEGYPVIAISSYAFESCDFVTKISIPDTVTTVGDDAFCDTAYYKNEDNWENGVLYVDKVLYEASEDIEGKFTVKDGTTAIAYYAFVGCDKLTEINIPGSVKILPYRTFRGCTSLTDLNVGEGTEVIEDQSFWGCVKLENINLPKTITKVGMRAIANTAFYKDDYNWDNGALYLGNILIELDTEFTGTYTVREGTTVIADSAFEECNITRLYLPKGLKILPQSALNLCKHLKNIYFNDDLEEIASICFPTYSEMSVIELPPNLKTIDYRAFSYTDFTEVKLPESLKTIDAEAFVSCKNLKEITIPAGVEKIGQEALGYIAHIYITQDDQGYYTTKMDDFVIKGYPNTTAEAYAEKHGFKFVDLTKEPEEEPSDEPAVNPVVTKKKANPLTLAAANKTVKAKKLKSKKQTVKPLTIKNAKGKVSVKIISVKLRKKKISAKKFKLTGNGKLTVKKGNYKTGTYSLKVKVSAKGNSEYKSLSKTVTVKLKVK